MRRGMARSPGYNRGMTGRRLRHRLRAVVSFTGVVIAAGCILLTVAARAQTVIAGTPELVLTPADANSMGILGWPDSNLNFVFANGTYSIFASNARNGSTQGVSTPDLDQLRTNHTIMKVDPLPKGSSGAFDHDYAGGGAFYYDASSHTLIELYHGEYWYGGGAVAWLPAYTSFGLAVSNDLGRSWRKLGQVLSPVAKRKGKCPADVGNGTLELRSDGYLYVYYSDVNNPCGDSTIALARGKLSEIVSAAKSPAGLANPGRTFMKYYNGSFSQPGVLNDSDPTQGGGQFTPLIPVDAYKGPSVSSVSFDDAIGQYVMVYVAGWDQDKEIGVALRYSKDGIRWSDPSYFKVGKTAFYPAMVNASGPDPNVLGKRFFIYYVNPFPGVQSQNLMRVLMTVK
jgi:hypothetical protein